MIREERDTRSKWLFLAIAILLGLIVSRLLNRLLPLISAESHARIIQLKPRPPEKLA
jgi:hypothetical protein